MNNSKSQCIDFLVYVISLLKDDAKELNQERKSIDDQLELSYMKGQLFSYYHFFNLLKSQCFHFDISEEELGINDFNEIDLLTKE